MPLYNLEAFPHGYIQPEGLSLIEQPKYNSQINWANPLTNGLKLLLLPVNGQLIDIINPKQVWTKTGSGSIAARPSKVGPVQAAILPSGSDNYWESTGYSQLSGGTGTFFIWIPFMDAQDVNGGFMLTQVSGTTFGYDMSITNHPQCFNRGAPAVTTYTDPFSKRNSSMVMSQTFTVDDRGYWYNGVLEGSGNGGFNGDAWGAGSKTIRFGGQGFYNFLGEMAICGFSSSVWRTPQAISFHQNPWQLFTDL